MVCRTLLVIEKQALGCLWRWKEIYVRN